MFRNKTKLLSLFFKGRRKDIWIPFKTSRKFVPKRLINNVQVFFQIMAWHRPGDNTVFELMMVNLLTQIYAPRGLSELNGHQGEMLLPVIFWLCKKWLRTITNWCLRQDLNISKIIVNFMNCIYLRITWETIHVRLYENLRWKMYINICKNLCDGNGTGRRYNVVQV